MEEEDGMNKGVVITKVVTKNFLVDFLASIQNFLGMNLTGYEKMINKGTEQIKTELREKGIKLAWYRYEISQLTNGAVTIMMYGDKK